MTDDENPYADRPDGKLNQLQYSISNLWDEFGNVDSVGVGLVVNLGLALIGVVIYWQTTGLVAVAGAIWAILNLLGIIKWVLGL